MDRSTRGTLLVITFASLVMATSVAWAGFVIPSHVYSMDAFDAAQKQALKHHQPLAFVYTNHRTSCGLCKAASLDVMNGLADDAVVVYVDTKEDWKKLPAIVKTALDSKKAGKYIPKTILTKADLTTTLFVIPYKRKPAERKAYIKAVIDEIATTPL